MAQALRSRCADGILCDEICQMPITGILLSDRYKILAPLGSGGMGEVYVARDQILARDVAVKVLPEQSLSNPVSMKRFEREAKALAALSHPNVLSIYDFGIDQGISYTVTELLKGETLRARIHRSRIPWKKAAKIAGEIAEGLSAAHNAGIIHRDLKPENVFLTSDDELKILDFGLARMDLIAPLAQNQTSATTEARLTAHDVIMGTIPYMSPEQVRGDEVDSRTDIFSFGCVIHEMLTGSRAYQRETSPETMTAILKEEPSPLPSEVPPALQRIVFHCLEKIPQKRFQSARDLAFALQAVEQDSRPSITPEPAREHHTSTLRAAVASFVFILLLAALGWYMLRKPQPAAAQEKSIAVLPFENLNEARENEYFSDGITEDVIAQLSKIRDLKVISRTSIMPYKHTDKSLRQIGRELGASVILEGSVRRSGNRVRIVGQLINALTDEHIWAETYDRDLKDVFEIQSDVAQQIATALRAQLSPAEKQRIERKPTENLAAYDYYLKAREKFNALTEESNPQAIELFTKAIEEDPNFALAYAGLADAISIQVVFSAPESVLYTAIEFSKKAISIDTNLAEGYEALGYAYQFQGRFHQSLDMEKKAVELNPNFARASGLIGKALWNLGRLDEALPWVKKYQGLEPTSKLSYRYIADVYRMLGVYSEAEKFYLQCLAIDPNYVEPYVLLAPTYFYWGKDQQLHALLAKMNLLKENNRILAGLADTEFLMRDYNAAKADYLGLDKSLLSYYQAQVGFIYWKEGNRIEAEKMFVSILQQEQKKIDQGNDLWAPVMNKAAVNAIRGDKAEAYRLLHKAIDSGFIEVPYLAKSPLFENLHGDMQFQQIVNDLQKKLDAMRKRAAQNL